MAQQPCSASDARLPLPTGYRNCKSEVVRALALFAPAGLVPARLTIIGAMRSASATRLYASSIAIVSAVYSIGSAGASMMSSPMMTDAGLAAGGWVMLVLGIIVLLHGIGLLTPVADRIGRRSGPLMVVWAVVMLLNQGLSAAVTGWGMSGSRMASGSMMADAGWDPGMIAIAVLMLASGLIMSRHASSKSGM